VKRWLAAVLVGGLVPLAGSPSALAAGRHHRRPCRSERCRRDDRDGDRDRQVCFAFCDDVIVIPGLPGQGGQTASLISDPKKLVEFPVTVVEMSLNFAQSILKLVV
jgi:hypothetical protein